MTDIIKVKNLSVSYEGKKIIENISFNVEDGDFLVIFGENGSGKSSLIKAMLSLKEPSGGEIEFSGGLSPHEIGYLPQTSQAQRGFPASVREVVLSGCLNKMGKRAFYGKKEKALAEEKMELLDIHNLKNESFQNLSGGQMQRVLLARALCSAGRVLLLDEPTSGLDPSKTADFYELICRINAQGTAVIMVSHDVHSSLSVAKHVLHIGNHSALFYGTAHDYELSSLIED